MKNDDTENNQSDRKGNEGMHWKQSDWSCKRQKDYGEIVSENRVKFPLPEVGSYVYVRVNHVYFKGRGKDRTIKCTYELLDRCVDAWNTPLVYKVIGYSISKDEPLAKGNKIILEARRNNGGGYVYRETFDTLRCAIGYYYLEVRPNDRQIYRSRRCNADTSPIAELTARAIRQLNEESGKNEDDEA